MYQIILIQIPNYNTSEQNIPFIVLKSFSSPSTSGIEHLKQNL